MARSNKCRECLKNCRGGFTAVYAKEDINKKAKRLSGQVFTYRLSHEQINQILQNYKI